MQGFALNMRRPLFQDVRVRKALALAFDFEWMNRQVFFNQYTRTASYFANSPMAAAGQARGCGAGAAASRSATLARSGGFRRGAAAARHHAARVRCARTCARRWRCSRKRAGRSAEDGRLRNADGDDVPLRGSQLLGGDRAHRRAVGAQPGTARASRSACAPPILRLFQRRLDTLRLRRHHPFLRA